MPVVQARELELFTDAAGSVGFRLIFRGGGAETGGQMSWRGPRYREFNVVGIVPHSVGSGTLGCFF